MSRRVLVQVIAAAVVIVFAIGIWSTGGTLDIHWLRFYSAAVLVAMVVLGIWEHRLWRLPVAQKIPRVPRDIRGTWKGSLESFWKDPATGEPPAAKTVYLVVRQSASNVSVVLLTNESRSTSSLTTICDDGVVTSLEYMYLNRPDSRLEHRSRIHHGSASLDITGRPASRLRGRYWTNRDSRGELDFAERTSQIVDDFRDAENLFGSAAGS